MILAGGNSGLFMGLSILSIAETLYWLVLAIKFWTCPGSPEFHCSDDPLTKGKTKETHYA